MTEILTIDAGATSLHTRDQPRAFLVVHHDNTSRVVELPDGVDVTFGRSRGATIMIDHEKVSRLHTRIRRTGDVIEIEDLASRNGTRIDNERITGITRLRAGDEISIGPATAVLGYTTGLAEVPSAIADATSGEARLVSEVDRAVRYRRPLTLALVRTADDAAIDRIAAALRPMDMVAEDVGDDYLVILPELDRAEGQATLERLCTDVSVATRASVLCPDDGSTVFELIHQLRTGVRGTRGQRPAPPPDAASSSAIIADPAMKRVYALVDRIADTAMTVLILGETGVGKEIVTEAIHRRSGRRDHPLIKLNCAALPETLLESELFGHERGSFTGADKRKIGFFEAADGGTLFLDEIGEIPLSLQAKLLRVLERKEITRVGGTAVIPTDTRLIAATHRDLEGEVRAGRFRQDLLFRIAGFAIAIPPLRDRVDEILPLAEYFLRVGAVEQNRAAPTLDDAARAALRGYSWPGNIRELKNAIDRALVLAGPVITFVDLPDKLRDANHRHLASSNPSDVRGQVADVERAAIVAALDAETNNQTRAARRLGLSRRALIYKMEKYGLKPLPKQ
ncbi:MAG: sigma 54-interacting transcriptional regulator [Proteobacteria bacterium]|nr:sigma 54-interacting transcriptional regulator [Pseudomonadota bacterium]